jgi:hypothetical protein
MATWQIEKLENTNLAIMGDLNFTDIIATGKNTKYISFGSYIFYATVGNKIYLANSSTSNTNITSGTISIVKLS